MLRLRILCGAVMVLMCTLCSFVSSDRSFVISGDSFSKDGENFRIVAGNMHYFRIVPEYWTDRIHTAKTCGINTITTYIPWNAHEPRRSHYDFSGMLDVVAFVKEAQKQGLLVIIRPPPYICAEWDFGGLPSWLLADSNVRLRCNNQAYLKYVDDFFDVLLPKLEPLQYSKGGPIIAMQVENEYGSYGNDKFYLEHLSGSIKKHGLDVVLFSSNGANGLALTGGATSSVLRTVNFGTNTNVESAFSTLRQYQPTGPLFCTEFWDGWLDHWTEKHHTVSPEVAGQTLDDILSAGASVSIYMIHGGTNFGFYNGANYQQSPSLYQPTITSYDYNAPVNESGDPTPKCSHFRNIIAKYVNVSSDTPPPAKPKQAYGTVKFSEYAPLLQSSTLASISTSTTSASPLTMEQVGQGFGFILYRTVLHGPFSGQLSIMDLHDRGSIFLDGLFQGTMEGWNAPSIPITVGKESQLDILVENMGRVNFGPMLGELKGITQGVLLDSQFQYNWTMMSLPMDNLSPLKFQPVGKPIFPAFYRGTFHVSSDPLDTFVALPGWTKGSCWINGFNLGRYWKVGPQQTLYLPAPLLKQGTNELIVLEVDSAEDLQINLVNTPVLDGN